MADVSVSVGSPTQINVTVAGATGGNAVVTSGSVATVIVTSTGDRGPKGDTGSVNLSDATPLALGTAVAGTSNLAARSDHVHPSLTVFPYSNLSGVPSTFAPSSHTHTANQIVDFANEAAKYGPVTSVNGQTGAVTISAGNSSTLTLSSAAPSNLGVASAGTSNLASRSDHTHNLPVIAYANLSGVPSNFPSNIASVSGLQSALDAKQTAGNYLTTAVQSVNNLTGNLSLIAAGGLSIAANGSTLTLTASADVANSTIDGGDYVGVTEVPALPTNLTSLRSGGRLLFSWTAPSQGTASITDYVVQYAPANSSTWTTYNDGTSTATNATLMGLTNGTYYQLRVAAVNPVGQGNYATLGSTVKFSEALISGTSSAGTWSGVGDTDTPLSLSGAYFVSTSTSSGDSAIIGPLATGVINYSFQVTGGGNAYVREGWGSLQLLSSGKSYSSSASVSNGQQLVFYFIPTASSDRLSITATFSQ